MQSPDFSLSYFELFNLEPAFELDTGRLHAAKQQLQASYHPDRYVNGSDREKRLSVQMASRINQAYEALKDPIKRAYYLLEIAGIEAGDDSKTTSDTVFLMEQIELREEIEDCGSSEDAMVCYDRIEQKLATRANQLFGEFNRYYSEGKLQEARMASHKMQFLQRLQHQLSDLQFELEDY
jgi:molecular chaperone HscB